MLTAESYSKLVHSFRHNDLFNVFKSLNIPDACSACTKNESIEILMYAINVIQELAVIYLRETVTTSICPTGDFVV
ncbi:hypothetical protein BT96DRAFT_927725 [Gymnopus androsaceus JB14]|uniref:Uncharacterized protein n=1 Tax=Gymnopus androsaceus JB14 TaxID=1447944 RepID=A0A6A4GN34_9AGAR|nr:hypothetical protein BT96DRAFT_927725 [Gymnopus androsaceus JB14]